MKTKIFIALLALSSILVINGAFAQISTSASYLAVHNSSKEPNVIHSEYRNNPVSDEVMDSVSQMNRKMMYMISEQFVFDNLSNLKKAFTVADIYFNLDDSNIRPDAIPILNNLVILMKENPLIQVASSAYSDSRMSKYNEKLATSRAQSAINYLISQGISADRLKIEKYGRPNTTNPCNNDPSCSLAVQQLNRRTEFNIIYNGINLGHVN
jgi:outer membrane protein OmpA-like peptidoglycan-associated protein